MQKRVWAMALFCWLALAAGIAGAESAGSWGHINQEIDRPEGWRQIVTDSAFQLGASTEAAKVGGGPQTYVTAFGTYPSLDGSTVAVPMAMEFARQHLGLPDSDLSSFVFFSMTHSAYEHLIKKEPNAASVIPSRMASMEQSRAVDLIIVTEPSDDELALAKEHGVTLVTQPVCLDAFVFITHKDNPVDTLTVEQIRKIYGGQIINWNEVGGPNEAIFPYQREPNSGSQTAMEKLVMQGRPLDGAERIYITEGMGDLVRRVGDYENRNNSLGYTYLYYIDTLYKSDDIKVLSIDGIAPTPENLRSGAYPFTTAYYAVYRKGEENQAGGKFAAWMLGEEGQRCIAQAGYIPVTEVE